MLRRHFLFSALPAVCLARQVREGRWVLLESGLSFADSQAVALEQAMLARRFGIRIGAPARLNATGFSYIRYHWPVDAMVRDFTEVVSIDPGCAEPIATACGRTIAVRQPVGRGGVIYLGSPLSPMLAAGDAQAKVLLASILSTISSDFGSQ